MSDPILLRRILEDSEFTKALTAFFQDQANNEAATSAEFMAHDGPNIDLARKHACYAAAYGEAMNRLREYARQV